MGYEIFLKNNISTMMWCHSHFHETENNARESPFFASENWFEAQPQPPWEPNPADRWETEGSAGTQTRWKELEEDSK